MGAPSSNTISLVEIGDFRIFGLFLGGGFCASGFVAFKCRCTSLGG